MMNSTMEVVEAIKNGQEGVSVEELFRLVNAYAITSLNVSDANNKIIVEMQVNAYEAHGAVIAFSQMYTDGSERYELPSKKVLHLDYKYLSDIDAIHIVAYLDDKSKLQLMIYHVANGVKGFVKDGFRELDLFEVKEILELAMKEDSGWNCLLVRFTDVFGFDIKMNNPFRTFIDDLDEENLKLHVSDEFNTFTAPIGNGCNGFYVKESDYNKEIIFKPYGQPFMEIKMLFFTTHNR